MVTIFHRLKKTLGVYFATLEICLLAFLFGSFGFEFWTYISVIIFLAGLLLFSSVLAAAALRSWLLALSGIVVVTIAFLRIAPYFMRQ
jgi:hypothetical protein